MTTATSRQDGKSKASWHSTGAKADEWEAVRQQMTPRPDARQFLFLCDFYLDEALRFSPNWDAKALADYVKARLLPYGAGGK